MSQQSLKKEVEEIVKIALKEDFAFDDTTSDLTIPQNNKIKFQINSREEIIFCGENIISETFKQLKNHKKFKNSEIKLKTHKKDGNRVKKSEVIATGEGDTKLILAAERTILNLIQHLSGIATLSNQFVEKLNDKKIKILDTRKTIPGLRNLQKYSTKIGGCKNHRFNLSDMILIKDNHIAASGSITAAINNAKKNNKKLKIEIECDNIKQVAEAIYSEPDVIMLDNMNISQIKQSSELIRSYKNKEIMIEVSGGINMASIAKYRNLDIDFISVGSLTHSVKAVDIGLDILN